MKFVLEIELGERMETPGDVREALDRVNDLLGRLSTFGGRWTIVGPDGLDAVGFWEVQGD